MERSADRGIAIEVKKPSTGEVRSERGTTGVAGNLVDNACK
jgi:hypothetical protein